MNEPNDKKQQHLRLKVAVGLLHAKPWLERLPQISSSLSLTLYEVDNIVIPILQFRKRRLGEDKLHSKTTRLAGDWSQDSKGKRQDDME